MRLLTLLISVLTFISAANAQTTLQTFMDEVRQQTRLYSTDVLNDTLLRYASGRAIAYTSSDVGGLESSFRLILTKNVAVYRIPDSTIQIVYLTFRSRGVTKSIKAVPPEYTEQMFNLDQVVGGSADDIPRAYYWWNDSVVFIPQPTSADTVYASTFIRHPMLTLDTSRVRLDADFIEAALHFACYKVWVSLDEYIKAAHELAVYEKIGKRAMEAHVRKFDAAPSPAGKQ